MTEQGAEPHELAALVGPFWSEAKVSAVLGCTPVALSALCEAGAVLGLVTSDRVPVYPVWQFHRRDGAVEVRPALATVLRTLRGFDGWTVAVLLHTSSPELDNHTPLTWLDEGRAPEAVGDLAVVVAREWRAGAA